jgi:hypothetical protein
MAIKATFNTQYGFEQTDAYIKINNFNGNRDEVNFDVLVFASEQARINGKTFMEQHFHKVPYSDGMSIASLYTYLKSLSEFIDPIDA